MNITRGCSTEFAVTARGAYHPAHQRVNLHRAFEDDVDVWMVIGRPNVMKLLISAYRELAIHTIFKILTRRSLYNTLLRFGSPVFSRSSIPSIRQLMQNRRNFPFIMIRPTYLIVLLSVIFAIARGLPQQPKSRRPVPEFKNKTGGLELPDNATLIRENIVDNFSCQDRIYGYYADMENDCQVFHVCMPQARSATRWSFICPAETVFNQATFVCTKTENSIPCEESENFYNLNEAIGKEVEEEESDMVQPVKESDVEPISSKPPVRTSRILNRNKSSRSQ